MNVSTREKAKKVGLALFARKGYEGTTMKEIADAVGIKKASLYAHFAGKEELFFAIYEDLDEEYQALTNAIMENTAGLDSEGKLRHMFEEYIAYYARHPEIQAFWNQIIFFAPQAICQRFMDHAGIYDAKVRQWIEDAIKEGIDSGQLQPDDPARVAFAYRAFREGLLNGMIFSPKSYCEERLKSMWGYMWTGIRGGKRSEE